MLKIKALDHLVLTTRDFDRCVWFYRDVLGMELLCREGHYALRFGVQKINIHRRPAEFLPAAKHITAGCLDFCLLTEVELLEVKWQLEEHGIEIEEGIVVRNGALGMMQSLYIRDPDGNLVEISSYLKQ